MESVAESLVVRYQSISLYISLSVVNTSTSLVLAMESLVESSVGGVSLYGTALLLLQDSSFFNPAVQSFLIFNPAMTDRTEIYMYY